MRLIPRVQISDAEWKAHDETREICTFCRQSRMRKDMYESMSYDVEAQQAWNSDVEYLSFVGHSQVLTVTCDT